LSSRNTEYRRPRRLRPGSRVAIVSPAGPVPPASLERGIACLRDWGLEVTVGKHVLDRHPTLRYLAGTDADRAADLAAAWRDPEIDAVLCARGGYGCLRTLEQLDVGELATADGSPMLFAGSSDVTALHQVFGARLGLVTLFSPMVATIALTEQPTVREQLRTVLFDNPAGLVISSPEAGPLVPGRASGVTFGGNASLLAAAVGDPAMPPPPPGSILLLEDVTEEPYRLDRIITQIAKAGWLAEVSGIALGSWTECGDLAEVRAVLADRLGGLGVPVAWELGFGHCHGQSTVPLGRYAELDADAGTLTFPEPALAD
jgi:muramoyltetrapeptide carboxypeptidase